MSLFTGSSQDETITPDLVSPSVGVLGNPKKPSSAIDVILAGGGNDLVAGGGGNDAVSLGAGDDTFVWNFGDGSDAIDGGDGFDTLRVTSSTGDDTIALSEHTLLVRNEAGDAALTLANMEWIEIYTGDGQDNIAIDNNLEAAGIQSVRIDLSSSLDPLATDGAVDTVRIEGSHDEDIISVFGFESSVAVIGTPTFVEVSGADTFDHLIVNGNSGDDMISASFADGGVALTLDGGEGDDELIGSQGNDILIGGNGDDFVTGGRGADIVDLGAGDDHFVWNPADGSDVVEGGDGNDSMRFTGNNVAEIMALSANGERVRLTRDIGNVVMDLNDIESIAIGPNGANDTIRVGDLSGTGLHTVEISLLNPGTPNDGAQDSVELTGTAAGDAIVLSTANKQTIVNGLAAQVQITGADVGLDRLQVNGGNGDDTIDASALGPNLFRYTALGGNGVDTFIGSAGNDTFFGGDGNDIAFMGAGDDTFVWNPGDDNDIIEGQAGFDTMLFNGAGANENVEISAVGERVRFFRDVANVTMDTNDVERIDFNALGGVDNIVVNDLSGTDVTEVAIDLAGANGAGDGASDSIAVNATNGDDVAVVTGSGSELQVTGLSADILVTGVEGERDSILIFGLNGDDVIEASGVSSANLVLDGGDGDDVLVGGDGDDVLLGGDGDDVLIGGAGDDVLIGGAGDDVVLGGDGNDVEIEGFVAGAGSEDRIDVRAFGSDLSFDWVMSHASEVDGNTVLDFGDEQITVRGVGLAAFHQDDFLM